MVLQIAYNLTVGTGKLQDWGAAFAVRYRDKVYVVTARHVLGWSKLVDPLPLWLRAPGSSVAQAWQGLVSPLLHPKADLAVFELPDGLAVSPLHLSSTAVATGDVIAVLTVPNAGLGAIIGPSTTLTGAVLAVLPPATTGRFSEHTFETTFPGRPGTSGAPVLNALGEVVGLYSREARQNGSTTLCVGLEGLADLL